MKESDLPVLFTQKKPWDSNDNSIWLASTLTLYRNIDKFKFPLKLDYDRRKQVISLLSKEFLNCSLLDNPSIMHSEQITPLQKEFLVEHFLSSQSFHQAHSGEAFIFEESGEFLAALNMQDHLQLQLIDSHGELESAWNRLIQIETKIGKAVNYSFSSKYGFLTANPNLCGTGLVISVFLQIPALIHTEAIDGVLEKIADDSLSVSGIQGNPSEIIGDLLVVQNNYTLGMTEENIISSLRSFTTKLLVEENSVRARICNESSGDIKDRVSRAFAILIHSYQIETVEALNAISLLKLGVELGWITGITLTAINRLFLSCRRAHLLLQYGDQIKQEEISHKRAEFIHQMLKSVKLVI